MMKLEGAASRRTILAVQSGRLYRAPGGPQCESVL